MAIDLDDLKSGIYISCGHERDCSGNHFHEIRCHTVGIDDFRTGGGFGAEDFGDPVLLEFCFRHCVELPEDNVALTTGWISHQQDDRQICVPILLVSAEDSTRLAQG